MGVNGIYGLSGSGMDIESMVKVGMMSKQNEYDKMAQKFTKNEWMKADYLEISSKITTFNSSTLSQYKMSNTMNAKSAESSSSAVKVTANSNAPLMNHKVEVSKLSTNAYLVGTNTMTRYDTTNGNAYAKTDSEASSIKLADVLFKKLTVTGSGADAVVSGNIASVTAASNSSDWTVTKDDNTQIAKDGASLTENHSFGENADGTASGLKASATAFEFRIYDGTEDWDSMTDDEKTAYEKSHTISYTYSDLIGENGATFNDLVSKINALGLNVKASYDSLNDRFSFYNTKGGKDNTIQIELLGPLGGKDTSRSAVATRNFFNNMGLYQSQDGELLAADGSAATNGYTNSILFDLKSNVKTGTDANGAVYHSEDGITKITGINGEMTVDGVTYKDITDNKVTVNGVTYTALNTTAATGAATVSVTQDTDSIIDKVKSFITDYNKLLADLYAKYDEKPNSDYKPLTQSQKDQMKEDQITKWEEKAKAGMLYHDQTLGRVIQTMRDAVSESVDGINSKYNSIYSLGISTTGIKGQLVLDEDKLKKALAEDPDSVYNIFAKLESTTTDSASAVYKTTTNADGSVTVTSSSNGNGIAQRLGDIFVSANKLIKDRAGSSADITEDSDLNNLLRNLQTKMSNFKKLMNSFEDALYKKYDAMESTLAKLGMQLNYVMGGQS